MKNVDIVVIVAIIILIALWYWKEKKDDLKDRLPDTVPPKVGPPSMLQPNPGPPEIDSTTQWQDQTVARIFIPVPAAPVGAPVTDARALVNKIPQSYAAN